MTREQEIDKYVRAIIKKFGITYPETEVVMIHMLVCDRWPWKSRGTYSPVISTK